ncbi:50S ribosomal protein L32 [Listeria monocytogenes]|nr:50S ribosomal protein L32 [Listeria monocytogenes]
MTYGIRLFHYRDSNLVLLSLYAYGACFSSLWTYV